ncbi:MAG TPA: aminoacyl--tRNA ligase-related protein [Candidatus Saccharimonadales bacterium]
MSKLPIKTLKEAPADEVSANAQLLIRAGFIHKELAGAYCYLPLGLMVLENIKGIVREEMNALGAHELIMTTLQRPELWSKTDRWDEKQVDIWFKTKLQNGNDLGLAWSHEEPIADMMKSFVNSYRDLPAYVYQFQTKLRNELRAKSGVMRGREFVMKDMYSLSVDDESHQKFYEAAKQAYMKVFARVGLGGSTFETFASGGAFTQFSHEFQTVTASGEDVIFLDEQKKIAVNEEVLTDEVLGQLGLDRDNLKKTNAAEVGNIFSFGTSKSEQLGLVFTDENDNQHPVVLGSYGIGITRLAGVIAEHLGDERGLVWPEAVAPYKYHLIVVSSEAQAKADEVYKQLSDAGLGVLYDDRDKRAGEKFADADLMGMPIRLVVGSKTPEGQVEYKPRSSEQAEAKSVQDLIK